MEKSLLSKESPHVSALATEGTPPAGGGAPAGNFSSSHETAETQGETVVAAKPKKLRAASTRVVRPDYHRQVRISYAEAALIAGVTVSTLQTWICRGKLPVAGRQGPYRINRIELNKYLNKGASR